MVSSAAGGIVVRGAWPGGFRLASHRRGEQRVRMGINLVKGVATFVTLVLVLVMAPGSVLDPAVAQESATQAPPGAPRLDAGSWALIDANTGLYLAGKDPDKRISIASTTKMMVALVALEDGTNLNERVTVSENAASYAGSVYSNVGLYPYDRVSVRDLLTAALVPSGTDAVYALAEHLGGGSVDQFVGSMNEKAKNIGLKNTHFENPAGIDTKGNYSSARDLASIVREAMKYPEIREIVGKSEATITTQDREIGLVNPNLLVVPNSGYDYEPATGVKTGTSPQAGPCLVASASSGEEAYVAVVLAAAGDLYRFEAPPAAKAGRKLGEIEVFVDGKRIGSSPLVAQKSYEEAGIWQRVKYWGSGVKEWVLSR